MKYKITLMSGAGNTFSVIDNRDGLLTDSVLSALAPKLTNTVFGQTEGLMAISGENTVGLDFRVSFFNPDGSSGMMCGNGGRCAIKYADELPLISNPDNVNFSMAGTNYHGKFSNPLIELEFDMPLEYSPLLDLDINGIKVRGDYVNVGTDHFIVNHDEIKDITAFGSNEMTELQKLIRNHPDLKPRGANANIYRVIGKHTIELSTYERGVEDITGACGTGAVSTAFSLTSKGKMNYPIDILPPSGIQISVDIKLLSDGSKRLLLIGPAEIINEFEVEL